MSSEQSSHNNQTPQMNLNTNTNTGDIHICGTCKINFSDLNMFMEHKRSQCLGPPPDTVHSQPLLELVTTNSTDDSMGLSLVGLHPLYRVNMDSDNLTAQQETRLILQHLRSQGISGSVILRSRLLESNSEQPVEISIDSPNSASIMQEMISMQHQQSRRDFEMDEEDVATLLANQLASEVVRGVNQSSVSSFGGELLSRASISQNHDTGSPEPANLFSSENIRTQKEELADTHSDSDESFNSPLPPQEEFILPDDELAQGNLDCQPDTTTDTQEVPVAQSPSRLKKRHCCDIEGCGFASFYLKDLARHMRKHTGERPFRCKLCSKSFSRADKLQIHQRIHAGIKSHTCTICPYATVDPSSLRKHMLIHTGDRPYKCQICSYRSRTTSHLTVHLRTHTGDCPFVCPAESCPAAFKTSSDLRRHARLHSGEKPYECDICEYTCNIKSNLKIHIRLNHTQYTPVPCPICNYFATSKRAAREHRKLHAEEIMKCGICPFSCTDRGVLKTHLEKHRAKTTKGVSCKHCQYTCHHKKNLKRHLRSKHPNVLLRKSRKNDSQGMSHIKGNVHENSQKVPLKPFCNKTHQCTICNVAFVREDSWRSHLRQHKGLDSTEDRPSELSARRAAKRALTDRTELTEDTPTQLSIEDSPTQLSTEPTQLSAEPTQLSARGLLETAEQRELRDMTETFEAASHISEEAPPPQSVYVYVTEGGGGGELPVVFSSSCGQYVTMLSTPLEGADPFVPREGGLVTFSHRHTLMGGDAFLPGGAGADFGPDDGCQPPSETHAMDAAGKKF